MILPMARVRVLGPRNKFEPALDALQDVGMLHLVTPSPVASLRPVRLSSREERLEGRLGRIRADLDTVLQHLGEPVVSRPASTEPATATQLARWSRRGDRLRRELSQLDAEWRRLEEHRGELVRYERFAVAFEALREGAATGRALHAYQLVLRAGDHAAAIALRDGLARAIGDQFLLETKLLDGGETAVLLMVPRHDRPAVDRLLVQAGIHELPVPSELADTPAASLMTVLPARRAELEARLRAIEARRETLRRSEGPELRQALAAVEDRRLELGARQQAVESVRSFVVEGWVPAPRVAPLTKLLRERLGETVVVEELAREEWSADDAPVVLQNPTLFKPFEVVTGMMPLPHYGTIDPTPFVAVFFPMFFGLILGDIAYGLFLALLSGLLHWKSKPDTTLRAVARVGGACAAFTIGFGFLFGEFLGDLGHRVFGMRPLLLNREEALLPFLGLAVAIGAVHITLGLVLGVANSVRGHPRQALGRGLALVMLALVGVALLGAVQVLPSAFFTTAVIALLVIFPVLIVVEGIIAPIEFLSTISNILSYARIMALGTASVMMAVVANRLVGAFGGAVIGVLFGLLFHLVNFALGVFAPTIHGLRLHYVEFFGKFYSPGGQRYAPFGHWRPDGTPSA
jgi:V/A-type H+-transporting ATPase subunit I